VIIEYPLDDLKKIKKPHKPPFKWAGSKFKMLDRYFRAGFLPPRDPEMFVDMFAGSTVISYWMRQLFPNMPIVINDNNPELIQMYHSIKQYDKFASYFQRYIDLYASLDIEDRKKSYYDLREIYRFPDSSLDPVAESALLLYLIKTGFNGIWATMKASGSRYATAVGRMDWKPGGKLFNLDDIKRFSDFLHTCVITCESYENTQKWLGKNVWLYADPPYRESYASYKAAGKFDDENQLDLVNFMLDAQLTKSYVAMSNREHVNTKIDWVWTPAGRSWNYGGWFGDYFNNDWKMVIYHDVKYTCGQHNKGDGSWALEVLIKNY
jgi:DNA adenine methylase